MEAMGTLCQDWHWTCEIAEPVRRAQGRVVFEGWVMVASRGSLGQGTSVGSAASVSMNGWHANMLISPNPPWGLIYESHTHRILDDHKDSIGHEFF